MRCCKGSTLGAVSFESFGGLGTEALELADLSKTLLGFGFSA